jgi:hypothetical protein
LVLRRSCDNPRSVRWKSTCMAAALAPGLLLGQFR